MHAFRQIGPFGFGGDHGVPQGRFAWAGRTNPTVRTLYSRLHDIAESELCVGLDNTFFTPMTTPLNPTSQSLWPHADQNAKCIPSGEWDIFQSVLYVWSSEADGTSSGCSMALCWVRAGDPRAMWCDVNCLGWREAHVGHAVVNPQVCRRQSCGHAPTVSGTTS